MQCQDVAAGQVVRVPVVRPVPPGAALLEEAVRSLLAERPRTSTACPSEVARRVAGDDEQAWRPLMEPVRRAARRLVDGGEVEVLQRGAVVDAETARGPVRLRATDGLRRPAPGGAA